MKLPEDPSRSDKDSMKESSKNAHGELNGNSLPNSQDKDLIFPTWYGRLLAYLLGLVNDDPITFELDVSHRRLSDMPHNHFLYHLDKISEANVHSMSLNGRGYQHKLQPPEFSFVGFSESYKKLVKNFLNDDPDQLEQSTPDVGVGQQLVQNAFREMVQEQQVLSPIQYCDKCDEDQGTLSFKAEDYIERSQAGARHESDQVPENEHEPQTLEQESLQRNQEMPSGNVQLFEADSSRISPITPDVTDRDLDEDSDGPIAKTKAFKRQRWPSDESLESETSRTQNEAVPVAETATFKRLSFSKAKERKTGKLFSARKKSEESNLDLPTIFDNLDITTKAVKKLSLPQEEPKKQETFEINEYLDTEVPVAKTRCLRTQSLIHDKPTKTLSSRKLNTERMKSESEQPAGAAVQLDLDPVSDVAFAKLRSFKSQGLPIDQPEKRSATKKRNRSELQNTRETAAKLDLISDVVVKKKTTAKKSLPEDESHVPKKWKRAKSRADSFGVSEATVDEPKSVKRPKKSRKQEQSEVQEPTKSGTDVDTVAEAVPVAKTKKIKKPRSAGNRKTSRSPGQRQNQLLKRLKNFAAPSRRAPSRRPKSMDLSYYIAENSEESPPKLSEKARSPAEQKDSVLYELFGDLSQSIIEDDTELRQPASFEFVERPPNSESKHLPTVGVDSELIIIIPENEYFVGCNMTNNGLLDKERLVQGCDEGLVHIATPVVNSKMATTNQKRKDRRKKKQLEEQRKEAKERKKEKLNRELSGQDQPNKGLYSALKNAEALSYSKDRKLKLHNLVNAMINPAYARNANVLSDVVLDYLVEAKRNPLMPYLQYRDRATLRPSVEVCIVEAILEVASREKPYLNDLIETFKTALIQKVMLGWIPIPTYGFEAVCRVYIIICEYLEKLDDAIGFAKMVFTFRWEMATRALASIASVWPEVFSKLMEKEDVDLSQLWTKAGTLSDLHWKQAMAVLEEFKPNSS